AQRAPLGFGRPPLVVVEERRPRGHAPRQTLSAPHFQAPTVLPSSAVCTITSPGSQGASGQSAAAGAGSQLEANETTQNSTHATQKPNTAPRRHALVMASSTCSEN